ncbi:Mth938-like domain-containing protein [Magnetospira thiophila]
MQTRPATTGLPAPREPDISLDITPLVPAGRQLIRGYGDGRFLISETRHEGSVLVFSEETLPWPVTEWEQISLETLAPVLQRANEARILLIGCGPSFVLPPQGLKTALKKDHGIVLEWMDTGAACRTFNVLLIEERAVAAALIAV